jgi:hypothetical protein
MIDSTALQEAGYLSEEESSDLASRHIQNFYPPLDLTQKGIEPRASNLPSSRPIKWGNTDIYDVNGILTFRDKTLTLLDGTATRVRTSANHTLPCPVWSIAMGNSLDIAESALQARMVALRNDLTPIPGNKALVCYSYPKLGLLCKRDDPTAPYVIDLSDLQIIDVQKASERLPLEGVACWSPYDLADPSKVATTKEHWTEMLANLSPVASLVDAHVEPANPKQTDKSLTVQLEGQDSTFFCAPAVGQMILQYFKFDVSQDGVAKAMGTGPTGTPVSKEAAAYEALSNDALTATLDLTPTFATAQTEIDNGRPLKSGVPGHARTVAGYRLDGQQWLYIYDPWPTGKGSIYWESWAIKPHTNFIHVLKK